MTKKTDFWEELQRDDPIRRGYQQLQEFVNSPQLLVPGEKWKLGLLHEQLEALSTELEERIFTPIINDPRIPSGLPGIYGYCFSLYQQQEKLAKKAQDWSLLEEKSFLQLVQEAEQYRDDANNLKFFVKGLLGTIEGAVADAYFQLRLERLNLLGKAACLQLDVFVQGLELAHKDGGTPAERERLENTRKLAGNYQALTYSSPEPAVTSPLDKEFPFLPDGLDYHQVCTQVMVLLRDKYLQFTADAQEYFRREDEETTTLVEKFLAESEPHEEQNPGEIAAEMENKN